METIYDKVLNARKNHICNYCGLIIEKNGLYERQVNKYNGEVYTWKSHPSCTKLASDLIMYDYQDEGLTQEDFIEYVHSIYDDYFPNIMNKPSFEEKLNYLKNINWTFKKSEFDNSMYPIPNQNFNIQNN